MPAWNDYSTKDSPDNTDTLMIKDETGTGKPNKRLSFANLAKFLIEKYTGSTIGGATQSVKAALDGINTKSLSPKTAPSTNTLDDFVTPGIYWVRGSNYTNPPFVGFGFLEVNNYTNNSAAVYQRYTKYDVPDESYIRVKANNVWGNWIKQPTRAEMNSKVSGTKLVWGKTLTFECPINGRYLVFVGGNNMFVGINYSDRATLNELVKKDDVTVTASKDGTAITITSSVNANITAFTI